MGWIFIDTRDFKRDMLDLIRTVEVEPGWLTPLHVRIKALVDASGMPLDADVYASRVAKLITAGNRDRAEKLVTCFDDLELSRLAIVLRSALVLLAITAAIVALIVFAIRIAELAEVT